MGDGIAARLNGVAEDAADARAVDSIYLHAGGPVVARPGRRPGPGLAVTIGGTPEQATVAPGGGIITDTTGGGSYRFVLPTSVSKPIATRPSAGTSRIDLFVARIRNTDVHPADGAYDVVCELVAGLAAASPVAPTVPDAALQIVPLTVPASGTITVGAASPRIAAAGGILVVANAAERDAISPVWDGIMVYREDTDEYEGCINGAWRTLIRSVPWTPLASPVVGFGVQYCVQGNVAYVQVDGAFTSVSGTDYQLTTVALPSRFCPTNGAQARALGYVGGYTGTVRVLTNGHLYLLQNTGANRATVAGTVTIPLG